MALFIEIEIDAALAGDKDQVRKLVDSCPVDIFAAASDGSLQIVERNLDECTLCELCLAIGAPGQVQIRKLYDSGAALTRSA